MLSTVNPRYKAWLANGTSPAAGGKLYTYETGTTIPKTTFSDYALLTPNANPIILDANGEASIFLGPGRYRFDLYTAADALISTFDPVGASSSGGSSLSSTPAWLSPLNFTHTQLQAAATSNNIEAYSLPARGVLEGIIIKPRVAFGGGAIAAYTLSIGLVSDVAIYLPPFSVMSIGATVISLADLMTIENYSSVASIRLAAASVSANLDASTSGSVDIWFKMAQLPAYT